MPWLPELHARVAGPASQVVTSSETTEATVSAASVMIAGTSPSRKSRALSRAPATDVAERRVATLTLTASIRPPWSLNRQCPVLSAPGLAPGLRPANPDPLPPPSLFEVDYLTVEHAKIYVGWSRHWSVVWLWFLS